MHLVAGRPEGWMIGVFVVVLKQPFSSRRCFVKLRYRKYFPCSSLVTAEPRVSSPSTSLQALRVSSPVCIWTSQDLSVVVLIFESHCIDPKTNYIFGT